MAKKDTFYFSHDYNSAEDYKCLFLRQQLGMEGYGIFWYLVEKLASAGGYLPMNLTPVLAMQMQVPEIKVKAVISEFGLFEINTENQFFSIRLNKHLQVRKSLSDSGKDGALKRWNNKVANRGAMATLMQRKGKEIKGNKIKEKESYRENIELKKDEHEKLVGLHGLDFVNACYDYLSDYKNEKGYKTKSDYLTIKRWVIDAVTKKGITTIKSSMPVFSSDVEEYKKRQQAFQQNTTQQ